MSAGDAGVWRGAGPAAGSPAGYAAAWLDLRAGTDAAARSLDLAERLAAWLVRVGHGEGPVRLLDVGAGAGSMPCWLAPRLASAAPGLVAQHWTLLDPDPALVALAVERVRTQGYDATAVTCPLSALQLSALRPSAPSLPATPVARVDALTCSALLDVLDATDLQHLADLAVGARAAVLAALTVTGDVSFEPADPRDGAVVAAHAAHQLRSGQGAAAAALLGDLLTRAGWRVTDAPTPWRLGPGTPQLLRRWLDGFAAAAAEADPRLDVAAWHAARTRAADAGQLHVQVGHVDLLALPPPR